MMVTSDSGAQQREGGVLFPAFRAFLGEILGIKFCPAFVTLELHRQTIKTLYSNLTPSINKILKMFFK